MICGAPSPGGGLACTLEPHGDERGHVWRHTSADDTEPPTEPT